MDNFSHRKRALVGYDNKNQADSDLSTEQQIAAIYAKVAAYNQTNDLTKPLFFDTETRDCKIFCVNLIIKHKFTQENINERFNRSFA